VACRIELDAGGAIARELIVARGPLARARGLIGRKPLRRGQGLLIEGGAQVHTWGLSYALDVVFCDRELTVLRVVRNMAVRRVSPRVAGATRILEVAAGALPPDVRPGARLVLKRSSP
jgi:uncharacterized membrane protein (UPF0127 family)